MRLEHLLSGAGLGFGAPEPDDVRSPFLSCRIVSVVYDIMPEWRSAFRVVAGQPFFDMLGK